MFELGANLRLLVLEAVWKKKEKWKSFVCPEQNRCTEDQSPVFQTDFEDSGIWVAVKETTE